MAGPASLHRNGAAQHAPVFQRRDRLVETVGAQITVPGADQVRGDLADVAGYLDGCGCIAVEFPASSRPVLKTGDNMADPWAFGWTQLLTLVGFAITIVIALGGFRTFDRWRREKLEERRIEVAFDALTIAYETQFVFQNIRSALTEGYEWAEMPQWDGDTEERRRRRGPYFAAIKRINANSKFFEQVWSIQPKCMALFGRHVEQTFMKLHRARRNIEVAAQMLAQRANDDHAEDTEDTRKLYEQLRRDIWDHGDFQPEQDRVSPLLREFVAETIAFAEPVIAERYRPIRLRWWA